jgi:hypothetical protein
MQTSFHLSFQDDWQYAPGAHWVHLPDPARPGTFMPPAPNPLPHKGFVYLHVAFGSHVLLFSSAAQLDHYIEVLSKTALPTSRQLSEASGRLNGPNQHWLSRLPGALKSPKTRQQLVKALIRGRQFARDEAPNNSFEPCI